jgi:hypothetical protein
MRHQLMIPNKPLNLRQPMIPNKLPNPSKPSKSSNQRSFNLPVSR